jgi:hypothetical protein
MKSKATTCWPVERGLILTIFTGQLMILNCDVPPAFECVPIETFFDEVD